jgi:LEA14-like dessication related protein
MRNAISHRIRPLISSTLLLATALLAPGCSGYRDPQIAVASASIIETTDDAMTLRFDIDLANPNAEPLKLVEFDYHVTVNGAKAYSGKRAAQATLASDGRRQVQVPAVLRFDNLGWTPQTAPTLIHYSIAGNLEYITPGEVAQILFDTGVRKPHASFSGAGDVQAK